MANHLHRRNLSNDGVLGVENAGGGAANGAMSSIPPRASSNSSKAVNGDVESPPQLPPRGRSRMAVEAAPGASNGTAPTVTATKQNGLVLTGAGWKAVSACINYSFCSVSMILVNKSLASRYVFA
jgi:hypothetical protein